MNLVRTIDPNGGLSKSQTRIARRVEPDKTAHHEPSYQDLYRSQNSYFRVQGCKGLYMSNLVMIILKFGIGNLIFKVTFRSKYTRMDSKTHTIWRVSFPYDLNCHSVQYFNNCKIFNIIVIQCYIIITIKYINLIVIQRNTSNTVKYRNLIVIQRNTSTTVKYTNLIVIQCNTPNTVKFTN